MIKGMSRRVIMVPSPDPELFENAIFILRNDAFDKGTEPEDVLKQAQLIADEYVRTNLGKKKRNPGSASAEHDISRGSMTKHRLFTDGGAHPYTALPFLEYYCSNNPNDRRDADEIWEMIVEKIDDNFEQWCKNIQ